MIGSGAQSTYSNSCFFEGAVMAAAGSTGWSKGASSKGACQPVCDYSDPSKTWVAKSPEQCALVKFYCTPRPCRSSTSAAAVASSRRSDRVPSGRTYGSIGPMPELDTRVDAYILKSPEYAKPILGRCARRSTPRTRSSPR